jgi:hypothetical protein
MTLWTLSREVLYDNHSHPFNIRYKCDGGRVAAGKGRDTATPRIPVKCL